MKKIFISAGDLSGEQHASRLMAEIRRLIPDAEFHGLGGKAMQAQGLNPIVPLEEISVVGFWEVVKKYSFFRGLLDKCRNMLAAGEFDAFIPVDYPGFNIKLAGYAKEHSIPVHYFIAPQLWAWGSGRAKKITGCVDRLLVVFPFEKEYFSRYGINTEYIGHPLLDDPAFDDVDYDMQKRENIIAMLPGSRRQEIDRHSELFARTMEIMAGELPGWRFGIAASGLLDASIYSPMLAAGNTELFADSRRLMKSARAGIVKTGTSTLEAALCAMPFGMIYKTSTLTYYFGKRLVNLDYLALVNILAKKPVAAEFIQADATPEKISREIIDLINNEKKSSEMTAEFRGIRSLLGGKGASARAAEIIANSI